MSEGHGYPFVFIYLYNILNILGVCLSGGGGGGGRLPWGLGLGWVPTKWRSSGGLRMKETERAND